MAQLREMGFRDQRSCHQALRTANGDVAIAAANLAANNGAAAAAAASPTGRIPAYAPTVYTRR
jgi:translation elongation factor EF-Ts